MTKSIKKKPSLNNVSACTLSRNELNHLTGGQLTPTAGDLIRITRALGDAGAQGMIDHMEQERERERIREEAADNIHIRPIKI